MYKSFDATDMTDHSAQHAAVERILFGTADAAHAPETRPDASSPRSFLDEVGLDGWDTDGCANGFCLLVG